MQHLKTLGNSFEIPLQLIAKYKTANGIAYQIDTKSAYIYFKGGCSIAYNSNMILKQDLRKVHELSTEVVIFLEDQKMHYKEYERILNMKGSLFMRAGRLEIHSGKSRTTSIVQLEEDSTGVAVRLLAAIPAARVVHPIMMTSINVRLHALAVKCMVLKYDTINYKFQGFQDPILMNCPMIDPVDQVAVIMPMTYSGF